MTGFERAIKLMRKEGGGSFRIDCESGSRGWVVGVEEYRRAPMMARPSSKSSKLATGSLANSPCSLGGFEVRGFCRIAVLGAKVRVEEG